MRGQSISIEIIESYDSDSRDREREGGREGWQSKKEMGRKKLRGCGLKR